MQTINSFSFHELCAPPTTRNNKDVLVWGEHDNFHFSARDFVTQHEGNLTDKYEIGEKLGSGGYGEVFSCVHKETNIERAVKILKKDGHCSEDVVLKEFNILRELDHPNILRQIEMFTDEHNYYIVTEICRGGELLDEIQAWGNFIEQDAAELMRHLLSAVNYCHKQGVAHRDLKPENILLEENKDLDSIKIIDFGLAQCVQQDTVMHDVAGSIYYIAPEVLEGSHTLKADIWSCGVIAFVLLSGYPPFDGHSDEDIQEEIRSGEYSFDDDVWDTISDQAKDFIMTLLEFDEGERPTAEECLKHPWIVEGRMASSERLKQRESVNRRAMEALYNLERFNAQSKLKQATCAFIASQLVLKEEKQKIDELFRALDIHSNGKLTKDDVCVGYKEVFGKVLEKDMVEQMFQRIDTDGSGYIDYSEFVIATMNEKDLLSNQKLRHAFNMFDVDGSGHISRDELVEVLSFFREMDETLDGDVITRIINQVDEDQDGEIDFDEFVAMMFKTAEDACEEEEKSKSFSLADESLEPKDFPGDVPELANDTTKAVVAKPALASVRNAFSSVRSLSPVKSIPSVKSISKNSVRSMKSISSSSVKSVKSAISSVRSFSSDGVKQGRNMSKRGSDGVKACLALFERTIADNTANGFDSHLFTGDGTLKRLSARLSFGKIRRRDSCEVVRRIPTPVNASLKGNSNHSMMSSSSHGSQRPKTTIAKAARYEELIKQNGSEQPPLTAQS